ncbi:hypothetical protein Bca4012_020212 [Brassica carinata]|uniref:Uncharacterized protein n=1 Tax=Brassica carinata TaxID=52824 RepID=A0A8X7WG61_BRACI|nr:hypothetical protein Bca52824_001374 [Brassica carinata]
MDILPPMIESALKHRRQTGREPRRNNPAAAQREMLAKNVSGKGRRVRISCRKHAHPILERQPQQNDSDNARTPPTFGNVTDQDAPQQQTPSNALSLYRDPLCVQPRSYVLPPEVSVILISAVKPSTLHFKVEGGSPVAWEKTKPTHLQGRRPVSPVEGAQLRDNVSVTAQSPPLVESVEAQDGPRKDDEPVNDRTAGPLENPSAKETSGPNAGTISSGEKIDAQDTGTPNDVEYGQQDEDGHEQFVEQVRTGTEENEIPGHDSGQKSNMEFPMSGEKLQKGPSPNMDVGRHDPPIVDANNEEIPALDEDERYDSCRDDMSTDNQMQENQVNQVSETEEDSKFVAGGGKRQRTRSRKLTGVYTAKSRLKKLFDSAKKVEYKPIEKTNRAVFKKLSQIFRETPCRLSGSVPVTVSAIASSLTYLSRGNG